MAAAGPPRSGAPRTELERIREAVARHFPVYETRIGPQSLLLAVHVDRARLERQFDELRQELGAQGYIPLLKREAGEEFVEVLRRPPVNPRGLWVNVALLAATLATTAFAGGVLWLTYEGRTVLTFGDLALGGLYFGLPLLGMLGVHEFAHYVFARRRHLDASLPFFLPVPPPLPFGTFGAFVSIRDPFPDRKAMFDVSAAGPLAGLAAALPISLGGLYLSRVAPVVPANYCAPAFLGLSYGHELFSSSLLWSAFHLFLPAPAAPLHPLALAGWVGILVTSINLLPIGALDGGRVFRALLGERARFVSYAAAMALFALSIFYIGWFIFGVLVLLLGLRNPPPLNDLSPLGGRRYAVGGVVAAVLVAGFVLVPIQVPSGAVGLAPAPVAYPAAPPGAAFAANLSASVSNPDPVAHGYTFTLSVTGATVDGPGGPRTLNGSELATWAATANWTFFLPNGSVDPRPAGPTAGLPAGAYLPIPAHGAATLTVEFSSPSPALTVDVQLAARMICPPTGGGSATASFTIVG